LSKAMLLSEYFHFHQTRNIGWVLCVCVYSWCVYFCYIIRSGTSIGFAWQ